MIKRFGSPPERAKRLGSTRHRAAVCWPLIQGFGALAFQRGTGPLASLAEAAGAFSGAGATEGGGAVFNPPVTRVANLARHRLASIGGFDQRKPVVPRALGVPVIPGIAARRGSTLQWICGGRWHLPYSARV
jgi:hypothetical protein